MRTAPLLIAATVIAGLASSAADGQVTVRQREGTTIYRNNNNNTNDNDGRDRSAENQQAAAARAQVNAARSQLEFARNAIRKNFEASPQWTQASADLKRAQTDYDLASKPVLERVRADPRYRSAAEEKKEAKQEVAAAHTDAARQTGAATPATQPVTGEVVEAANASLAAGQVVSKLEQEALDADPKVTDAKARRDQAAAKVQALEKAFEADLLNDSGYQQAKTKLDAAEAQLVAYDRRGQP
jgi:hypothetical protein